MYVHLDCLDGKQARRTKSSSPLGQLFDHGCDALSVNLLLANIACSLSIGCSWTNAFGNMAVMLTWMLAQWEEYHTSIMLYGNSFLGVLEANYMLAAVHLLTFFLGPAFWRRPVADVVPLLGAGDGAPMAGWTMNELMICSMVAMGSYQGFCNLYRVFTFETARLPADERGHKQVGSGAAALHFVIIMALLALGTILLWTPVPEFPGLCRVENALFGVGYALQASQLIMAHMSKEPFQPSMWPILALAAAALNLRLKFADPLLLAGALAVATCVAYLHYVLRVIAEICAYLGIDCLRIPVHPPVQEAPAAAAAVEAVH